MVRYIAATDLRLVISQYRVAFHNMVHHRIPQHYKFRRHPDVSMVGFGRGIDAMGGKELPVHHYICAGGTEVAGASLITAIAAQQLSFYGDRKVLVFGHAFGSLAMQHGAAVAEGPSFPARRLLAHKTVFYP